MFQKVFSKNICLPVNADGNIFHVESISIKIGSQVIILIAWPESYCALNIIFATMARESWQAQTEDKSLSFIEKWNSLAVCLRNAQDFLPENERVNFYSHHQDVDPQQPPSNPWTGEQLNKHFCSLKTKFALVDESFSHSGNLEAGGGSCLF